MEDGNAPFRRRCWVLALCSWAAVALLLLVLVTVSGLGRSAPEHWGGGLALYVVPSLFYVYALWVLGAVFARLSRGAAFAPAVARGLRHAGAGIALGSVSSIAGVLLLNRLITGRGSFVHLDVPGIVLACVGIGLFLLAQLFERAREIQAELDEMV